MHVTRNYPIYEFGSVATRLDWSLLDVVDDSLLTNCAHPARMVWGAFTVPIAAKLSNGVTRKTCACIRVRMRAWRCTHVPRTTVPCVLITFAAPFSLCGLVAYW